MLYDDGDTQNLYHNEVKDHLKQTKPKTHQWKEVSVSVNCVPTEKYYTEHNMSLDYVIVRAIDGLKFGLDDLSESIIPHKMIRIPIDALTPITMTSKEVAVLKLFFPQNLTKLYTWDKWQKSKHKQLN